MQKALGITLVAALLALPAVADEEVHHPFAQSISVTGIKRLVIDIPAGEVRLRNGDSKAIAISGEARRSFDGSGRRDANQAMIDDVTAVIRVEGGTATIARRYGPNAGSWTARSFHTEFKLRVDVPKGVDVEFGTKYGEVDIDGDFGDVNVDLHAGEVHLAMPRSSVHDVHASVRVGEVHADFGDYRVANEGVLPHAADFYNADGRSHVNVHTTAGEVHVTLRR